jgi:hypothetical protein
VAKAGTTVAIGQHLVFYAASNDHDALVPRGKRIRCGSDLEDQIMI